MDLHTLTHTSYIEGTVNADIDNEKLAQVCIERGLRVSEDPLNHRFEDYKLPNNNEEWDKVIANIQSQWTESFSSKLDIIGHWAAIHRKYEATNTHMHHNPDTVFFGLEPDVSGVYYAQVPKNAGVLMFDYDVHHHLQKQYWLRPIVGKFVLFPSWMRHFVTKNLSDDIRVSISFNATTENSPI